MLESTRVVFGSCMVTQKVFSKKEQSSHIVSNLGKIDDLFDRVKEVRMFAREDVKNYFNNSFFV